MDDNKLPMKSGSPGQGLMHAPGAFGFDANYIKHMQGPSVRRPQDVNVQMPRFAQQGQGMVNNDAGAFESLASHPGLRVQLPSHDQLSSPAAGKFEEGRNPQLMLPGDHDGAPMVKQQIRFPPQVNFNSAFAPNMMNYGVVAVSPMIRFPAAKQSMEHFYPHMDAEVKQMDPALSLSQVTKQQVPPPLVKPQMPPANGNVGAMDKYQQQLSIKEEPVPAVSYHDCNGGVVYDKGPFSQGGRWLVFWECRGRMWRRSFLVNVYGKDGSKELAEQFWVTKMRSMQLYKANQQTAPPAEVDVWTGTGQRLNKPKKRATSTPPPSADAVAGVDNSAEQQLPQEDNEVFWDADSNSWCFECLDTATNTIALKRLPVSDSAQMEDVKKEAIQQRVDHWRDVVKAYTETEYCGHSYERTRTCWRVSHWVPSKGINRNRYFNISKYGYLDAKDKSRMYRLMVHDLGGEEPESFPFDAVPPPEFFEDPVTKFYHRILYSMRGKDRGWTADSKQMPL